MWLNAQMHNPNARPAMTNVEPLHVAGNVYMIAGAGGNIAVSIGGDGVIMVDSGAAAAGNRFWKRFVRQLRCCGRRRGPNPRRLLTAHGRRRMRLRNRRFA